MKLSACMIVKDEEKMLERTLPTLSKGVDEIILVDTGSTDNTVKVAERFGAKIYYFPWRDDFSAARNESLKHATGDWILWIDADEFMTEETLAALRKVLEQSDQDAYFLPIYECKLGETEGSVFYFRLKVFRNHKGFRFERAFNEEVYTAQGELVKTTNFLPEVRISHWGRSLSPERTKSKKARNFKILAKVIKENPKDPFYHFLLANNYLDVKSFRLALYEYSQVVELDPSGPLAATALIRKARILINQQKYEEAYACLKDAAKIEPWNAEIYNLIGSIYLYVGNTEKAITVLEYSRNLSAPRTSGVGIDLNQYTYFPHFLLGNAYLLAGRSQDAVKMFKIAYRFQPNAALRAKIEKLEKKEVLTNA